MESIRRLASLFEIPPSFAASVQRQQVSMDRWRRSVESVAEVIGTLEQTTKGVTIGAEANGTSGGACSSSGTGFLRLCKELQKVFQWFLNLVRWF